MDRKQLESKSLEPFDNLGIVKKYFSAVKAMDKATQAQRKFDTGKIMSLWQADGKLTIGGKPIGEDKSYAGQSQIESFYQHRAKGVHEKIAVNLSTIDVANAKSSGHIVASGQRYVVNHKNEGMQVPFTHNFTLNQGKIAELKIHIGSPATSEIAPLGTLAVEDMGRLAAMAWMVA